MERPKKYNLEKGVIGNIEDCIWENDYRKNEISNETAIRTQTFEELQEDTDTMILDYEERLILLEVGE